MYFHEIYFQPHWLTLSSAARTLNPKVFVVQGCSSGGGGVWGAKPLTNFFLANPYIHFFQNFICVQSYMKDAECAEKNEK